MKDSPCRVPAYAPGAVSRAEYCAWLRSEYMVALTFPRLGSRSLVLAAVAQRAGTIWQATRIAADACEKSDQIHSS
jgi:hypothetical protein